jgi:hypothetical protein
MGTYNFKVSDVKSTTIMNFNTIDPHLSKLCISEGGKLISRNAASSRTICNEENLIARSTRRRRRELIKKNCEELRRCHHMDVREPVAEIREEVVARTGACRMRKLWDFDSTNADMNNNISKNNLELLPKGIFLQCKYIWRCQLNPMQKFHVSSSTAFAQQDCKY